METLFSVNQAAFILKIHPLTIRRYIKEDKLKAIKVGGNVRIKESQLHEFNKDFSPRKPSIKSINQESKSSAKIFLEIDPLFQLQGRGAGLNIT